MVTIAIPSSSLINETDEKIKVYKIGSIARAAAIFRVEEIIIYHDSILDESDYIAEVLEYLETPQYLRKYLFPLKRTLRYAGILPPLAIPSHKTKHLKAGEVREGVVRHVAPDGTRWVDIGVKALASLAGSEAPKGARVTVRVCSKKPLVVEEAEPDEYWGYKVRKARIQDVLKREEVVITSRHCRVPEPQELKEMACLNPTFVFGNPEEGVFEIFKRMGIEMREDIKCWNTVPHQGTRTVRLEEAIFATLSIFNLCRYYSGVDRGDLL
jgi:hypothetical protein